MSKTRFQLPVILGIIVVITAIGFLVWRGTLKHESIKTLKQTVSFEVPLDYTEPLVVRTFGNLFQIQPVNANGVTRINANLNSTRIDANNSDAKEVVKYIDAYQSTDVEQIIYSNKLKESIILKGENHPESFSYGLPNIEDYDYQFNNQDLVFYQKGHKGEELYKRFMIPEPYMLESSKIQDTISKEISNSKSQIPNQETGSVEMKIEGNKLILTPDMEWIHSHQYPIIIDPTIEIEVLNLHSHPQQGENWEVEFTTQGMADLRIIPADQATINDDEFRGLYCGDTKLEPQILEGDVIYFSDWECNKVARVVHYTLKAGKHYLLFEFGEARAEAFNSTVLTLRPNGAGSETSITNQYPDSAYHWDKTSETTADNYSTYVEETGTSYTRDLYSMSDSNVGSGLINSVTLYFRVGPRINLGAYAKASIKTNGTVYDGSERDLDEGWYDESETWNTNPYTNNPWTWSEVNDLEAGASIRGKVNGPPAPPSIVEDTDVLLVGGGYKKIQDIEVGDAVVAYDFENMKLAETEVLVLQKRHELGYYKFNNSLKATADHLIWSSGDFVPAEDVKIGDTLLNKQGIEEEVTKIEYFDEEVNTYDLSLNNYYNYFAGGYDVHNGYAVCTQIYVEVDYTPVEWYNSAWTKRKALEVKEQSGSNQTNYQVKFSIPYDANMNADFSDLRFVNASTSNTLLDYWIEDYTESSSATVWVEIDSLTANSTSTIDMYYGNSSATSAANGTNTFVFFDDFSGSSLDTDLWQIYGGGLSVNLASGLLSATSVDLDPAKIIADVNGSGPTGNNLVMRSRFRVNTGSYNDQRIGLSIKTNTSDGQGYNYTFHDFSTLATRQFLDDAILWGTSYSEAWTKSTWYIEEIYHDGTNVKARFDDGTWRSWARSGRSGYFALNPGGYSETVTNDWDFALIRKIVSSEPSYLVSSIEESAPAASNTGSGVRLKGTGLRIQGKLRIR